MHPALRIIPQIVSRLYLWWCAWDKSGGFPLKKIGWTNLVRISGMIHQVKTVTNTVKWHVCIFFRESECVSKVANGIPRDSAWPPFVGRVPFQNQRLMKLKSKHTHETLEIKYLNICYVISLSSKIGWFWGSQNRMACLSLVVHFPLTVWPKANKGKPRIFHGFLSEAWYLLKPSCMEAMAHLQMIFPARNLHLSWIFHSQLLNNQRVYRIAYMYIIASWITMIID